MNSAWLLQKTQILSGIQVPGCSRRGGDPRQPFRCLCLSGSSVCSRAGGSIKGVARKFAIDYHALRRHWRNHVSAEAHAAEQLPPAILDQIKPRGRIVLPLGPDEAQWLTVVDSLSRAERRFPQRRRHRLGAIVLRTRRRWGRRCRSPAAGRDIRSQFSQPDRRARQPRRSRSRRVLVPASPRPR
jgi:Protein-L-isoaspartate(D-aspartate) O-methyltransferase (PCMT)